MKTLPSQRRLRPPPQLLLPFPNELPENALPPPVRRRCKELLRHLLMQTLIAEVRGNHLEQEDHNERKD
jgi:hypothetical protein